MSSKYYGDVIWTNHALTRLSQRGLTQKLAWTAFQYPEVSTRLDGQGTMEYKRSFGNSVVTVIAKRNDRRQWIILSCWIDPPLPGTLDAKRRQWYQKFRQAGFWKKLRMQLLSLLTGRDY